MDTRGCNGGIAVVEGALGIGKTTYLRVLADQAESAGLRVLIARAHRNEQDLQFGVVQQIFDHIGPAHLYGERVPTPVGADLSGRSDAASYSSLCRAIAQLATSVPVLIVIDDVQWTDTTSLRWLGVLARRLAGQPVTVVCTVNPGEQVADSLLVAELLTGEHCRTRLRLGGLSAHEVAELAARYGKALDLSAAARLVEDTAGNPLLVKELLTDSRFGPRLGLVYERIAAQLRRISPRALDLVGVAALARFGPVDDCIAAKLLRLDEPDVRLMHDRLAQLEVLTTDALDLHAPVLGEMVYRTMPQRERSRYHWLAGCELRARGTAAGLIAQHLLRSQHENAAGAVWPAEILTEAGDEFRGSDPAAAVVRYLRALDFRPPDPLRCGLLRRLGQCHLEVSLPAAVDYLGRAYEFLDDPEQRAELAVPLADAMMALGDQAGATEVLSTACASLESGCTTRERIEQDLVGLPHRIGPRIRRPERGRNQASVNHVVQAVALAQSRCWQGRRAEHANHTAHQLLRGSALASGSHAWYAAVLVQMWCEDHRCALEHSEREVRRATRERGSLQVSKALALRAEINYGQGRLAAAAEDVERADDMLTALEADPGGIAASVLATWIAVRLECGDVDGALDLVARAADGPAPASIHGARLAHSTACARLAGGQARRALDELLACGALAERLRVHNPTLLPWRSAAAAAAAALGDAVTAESLAAQEVRLARRWGTRGSLGRALRVAFLVGGEYDLTLLNEAIRLLENSTARLELTRLLELTGRNLVASGRQAAGRSTLRRAYENAVSCGADALAAGLAAELRDVGGRLRQPATGVLDLLTICESQVARMAATGMTNRSIARQLRVTQRNVEAHLTQTYRKLGVAGRFELARYFSKPIDGAPADNIIG